MVRIVAWVVLLAAPLVAVGAGNHGHPKTAPAASYEKAPAKPPQRDDYVIRLEQMATFYDVPGEFGHMMIGKDHGFERLSFIITETRPGGGPPLHAHETEEAHVLLEGSASYVMEEAGTNRQKTFSVRGPYIVRIPAGVPHTFLNSGDAAFNLVAVFPDNKFTYKELGPNPLVKKKAQPRAKVPK